MMQWLVCEPVPDEYVPMLLEEMELDGRDARAHPHLAKSASGASFPVVVIGCGESGLLAGIRLKEAGIPFTIIEKNAGVGGTWWQNTYPGARVDVGNHFYCYSFEPTDQWTHFFAEQPRAAGLLPARDGQVRHRPARAVGNRGHRGVLGRCQRHLDRSGARPQRSDDDTLGAGGHQRRRAAQPAAPSGNTGTGPVLRAGFSLRRVGPFGRPARQARGVDRRGRQRIPDRTGDSRRRREAHRLPAHRPMDVPQPELPRRSGPRRAVGAAAPAVLRPLVSVPAVLAGL